MLEIPQRQWEPSKRSDGVRTAFLTCPECGNSYSLTGLAIADDGVVTPSVVCPCEGCNFHEWVKLIGWSS